jgi:hypothetical protein
LCIDERAKSERLDPGYVGRGRAESRLVEQSSRIGVPRTQQQVWGVLRDGGGRGEAEHSAEQRQAARGN